MTTNTDSTAEFIEDLSSELAEMARSDGLEDLAFLLEIAALEAGRRHDLPKEQMTGTCDSSLSRWPTDSK